MALAMAGLVDTGIHRNSSEAPYSAAEFPDRWVIVWSESFDFASAENLISFSANTSILSCQVHEGIMYSAARFHENGRETWSVSHSSWKGPCNLEISGTPPAQLAAIRDQQFEKQRQQGSVITMGLPVDYVWDIPMMLAESICGHRHDFWRYDWGLPQFTIADQQ